MAEIRYWAVVPAAGVGRRMGTAIPKQYLPLAGRTVIEHTLDTLMSHPRIHGGVVAVGAGDSWWKTMRLDTTKPLMQVAGGMERGYSVLNALHALAERAAPDDWILVHDAVRPCLRHADIDLLIDTLHNDPVGGLLALPVRDTLKRADPAGRVSMTVDRSHLWHALTPQMFRLRVLTRALHQALEQGLAVTDEASALEAMKLAPRLVEGHAANIKITRPEDLLLAELFLAHARDT